MQGSEASVQPIGLNARGVWAPALTALHEDLSIDEQRVVEHVEWLLSHGCHGVVLFGTTGEGTSFSVEERMRALEAVLTGGADPERLMIGTGCCALSDTVRLTAHAAANGCRKVLVLPPFYYKGVSDDGLYRSYAEVIERVGDAELKLFFYHFPRQSATPISETLIERLAAGFGDTIAGVKDSSGDWSNTQSLIRRFPRLAIFPGSETLQLDALEIGGAGCISASANVNGAGIRRVYEEWEAGAPQAESAQQQATAVRAAIEAYPLCPALKAIVAHYRADPGWSLVRPPLQPLNAAAARELVANLERLDFGMSI